jgi:hypothetical protein
MQISSKQGLYDDPVLQKWSEECTWPFLSIVQSVLGIFPAATSFYTTRMETHQPQNTHLLISKSLLLSI